MVRWYFKFLDDYKSVKTTIGRGRNALFTIHVESFPFTWYDSKMVLYFKPYQALIAHYYNAKLLVVTPVL